jgi:hypothetical protein
MRILTYAALFLSLTLVGCAGKKHIIEYAGKDFVHSSSLCLDGLLVNMDANYCMSPVIDDIEGTGLMVTCSKSFSPVPILWNDGKFLVVPTQNAMNYDEQRICSDFNFTIFYITPREVNGE